MRRRIREFIPPCREEARFHSLDGNIAGSHDGAGGWLLLANRALLSSKGYPEDLARLGTAIGAGLLVALPIAGLAFAEQLPRWLRQGVGGAVVAVGAVAWTAWPYWYFLAGRHLSHVPAGQRRRRVRPLRPTG